MNVQLWLVAGSDGKQYYMELGCRRVRSVYHPYLTVMFTTEPLTEASVDMSLVQQKPDFAEAGMYRAGPPNWKPVEFVPLEQTALTLQETTEGFYGALLDN